MIYEPREITCRDGRSCILRSAAVTDANDLIRYLKVTAGETPFLIREPDEISLTPEQEEHFIEGIVKEPRELMLIGTVAGEHVGNCFFDVCLYLILITGISVDNIPFCFVHLITFSLLHQEFDTKAGNQVHY